MDLVLPLKAEYFNAIKDGTKTEEFRLRTPFWRKRLEGKTFDRVVLTLGYPGRDDAERRIVRPWGGMRETTITHPHFGAEPVDVDFNTCERQWVAERHQEMRLLGCLNAGDTSGPSNLCHYLVSELCRAVVGDDDLADDCRCTRSVALGRYIDHRGFTAVCEM